MKLTWQHLALVALLLGAVLAARIFAAGDDQTLVLIVTTVLAAIFGPKLASDQAADKQADQLDAIEAAAKRAVAQTNGVLDQRIQNGVSAALRDHGLLDPPAGQHAAPPEATPAPGHGGTRGRR